MADSDREGRSREAMSSDRPDVIERRSDYPPHAEHALLRVMVETASQTGDAFFRTLVYNLAKAMQVRYAFLSECTDKSKTRVRTLAFWADGRFAENFEYDLKGTPCEDAVGGKFCFHPKSVQSLFPTDLDLVDLEAESYYGMPVCASSGEVLGLLAILDDRPMVEDKQRHAILSVLGAHAGTELERTRTEEALRTTAQRYRLLAENMTDVIWTTDKEGYFTYMSPSVNRLSGSDPKNLIGVHFSSVMANQSVEFTKDLFENTVSGKGGPSVIEVEQKDAEGNPEWCEVSVVALRDSAGDFAGLQGITRDITVRKRAGDVLRSIVEGTSSATGEAFFRSLVQHLASALETDYAFVAELNESTSETVSTLAVWDGNDFGDDFVVDLSGTPCAMQSDESIHYIESAAHGKFAPESFIAKQKVESLLMAPLKDAAGTPLGVVAVMNVKSVEYPDFAISMMRIFAARAAAELGRIKAEKMQRSLEAQVQHAQKLESLGVLAGGIAHDFNNLLAGIMGYASLSLLKLPDDSPLKENLTQIEIAAQRAAELTKQMLAYSGKGRFEIRPLDLSEQVGEIADLLKASISKKATLRYEFADDLPSIEADKAQIQQVVMNLITNASEALEDESGTITMRTGVREA
ncbi:MAG: PAS domain S-box protein, partial [Candidatus Hydrogenedentes bacterium]|nr:PAS domain S-box protein [Candidatus Hydrogenedentota bacterium]